MKSVYKFFLLPLNMVTVVNPISCSDSGTAPDTLQPPTNIVIQAIAPDRLQLSWERPEGDVSAIIIDRKKGEENWERNYVPLPADSTTFTDSVPTNRDTLFLYRLRSVSGTDTSDFSATYTWFPPMTLPDQLSLRQIDYNRIQLAWNDNSIGEEGFRIDRRTGTGQWQSAIASVPANRGEFIDTDISATDSIYYRVCIYAGATRSDPTAAVAVQIGELTLENLYFGSTHTLEVATWNIQNFPRRDERTIGYLARAVRALEIDIMALQEIESAAAFQQLLDSLPNWKGYRANSAWYDIDLAYLWRTADVQVDTIYEILRTEHSALPRTPLVLEARWQNVSITVINNHYKCCGDGIIDFGNSDDEEYRHFRASQLLDEYIQDHFSNRPVIVVGDLNDEISNHANNNVFQIFIDQPEQYQFADLTIANGSSTNWSYPSWPSHLDHILITDELFDEFAQPGSEVATLRIERYMTGGWNNYALYISDHRPVALKLSKSE